MKLVRFGAPGAEKPGLCDTDGTIRDLSAHVKDITGDTLSPASLDKLRKLDAKTLPAAPKGVRIGAPVGNVRNFIAIGLNYADHAKEAGQEIPKEPIIFAKLPNCIVGPDDDVMIPKGSTKLDWEIEIAFVVGKRARYIEEKDARRTYRRLHHLQRHLRAPLPDRARRPVDEGQVRRDLRPARAMARHHRRDQGSAGAAHAPRRQRQAHADRQYAHHDLHAARTSCTTCRSSWCWSQAT